MLSEEVKRPKSNKKNREVISLSIEEEKKLIEALLCENKYYIINAFYWYACWRSSSHKM